MRIFVAYRFTGEDRALLESNLKRVTDALSNLDPDVYCNITEQDFFDDSKFSVKQIMEHGLRELDKADILFAFVNSKERSEGVLIEIGYAKAKGKKIILASRVGAGTHSSQGVADVIIEFEDLEDLVAKIGQLKI